MIISDDKKLRDIQMEFSEKFPFLKIEFYARPHVSGEGSPEKEHLDLDQTVGEVRSVHNKGDLSIDGHLKVQSLEKNFAEQYGLYVQVFRRSGKLWLQTISTDEWTLTKQDRHGRAFSEASLQES